MPQNYPVGPTESTHDLPVPPHPFPLPDTTRWIAEHTPEAYHPDIWSRYGFHDPYRINGWPLMLSMIVGWHQEVKELLADINSKLCDEDRQLLARMNEHMEGLEQIIHYTDLTWIYDPAILLLFRDGKWPPEGHKTLWSNAKAASWPVDRADSESGIAETAAVPSPNGLSYIQPYLPPS